MRRIAETVFESLKSVTVALLIIALVVSGVSAAERLYDQQQPQTEEEVTANATLNSQPDPSDPAREMAHGAKPWTEQPAFWRAALAVPGSGGQAKDPGGSLAVFLTPTQSLDSQFSDELCSSLSLVDSRVGHRFTLVGARPSGTS